MSKTWYEKLLYDVPSPGLVRDRPMQVMALGMPRTGSKSLQRALQELGYDKVYHSLDRLRSKPLLWAQFTLLLRRKYDDTSSPDCKITAKEFDEVFGDCEALVDFPPLVLAPELINAYPDAKVVLTTRNVDS